MTREQKVSITSRQVGGAQSLLLFVFNYLVLGVDTLLTLFLLGLRARLLLFLAGLLLLLLLLLCLGGLLVNLRAGLLDDLHQVVCFGFDGIGVRALEGLLEGGEAVADLVLEVAR